MRPKKPTTTIPERLELEYMLDQKRLFQQLRWFTVAAISKFTEDKRQDSPGLQAFLQMSVPEILNERKLRLRLRYLATRLSDQKLRELTRLLGRGVRAPSPGLIDNWIDDQVVAIQASVQQWLTTATASLSEGKAKNLAPTEMATSLAVLATELQGRASKRASFRILQLNSQIIEEVARGAGSSHYRWITEQDSRVRENHQPLHGRIVAWSTPPMGGGTRAGDQGHAGSGYGCRCIAKPLPGGLLPVP